MISLCLGWLGTGFGGTGETLYAWRGEKLVVWRDLTNRTATAVQVRPTCEQAFVRVGVGRPVKGDNDILYADRVEWGGTALVETGEVVRLVAEIAVPRTGTLPTTVSVRSPLGSVDYPLAVCERQFPEGAARRTFLDLWQHPWAVARYYQVKPFSPEHYAKMRPLWTRLGEAGQKVVTATIMNRPWAHQCFDGYGSMVRRVKRADGSWKFDYAVFDAYVKFAFDCGLGPQIHCYSVFPFRLKRYYWEDEKGREQSGDFDVGSPEYLAYWEPFLVDFAKHLKETGLFDQTYIALDERSPAELRTAYELVKRCGGFKIAMAGDRSPELFDGVEIDNFSIALQCVTPPYIASAKARRTNHRTTTVYVAGGNPCTGTAQPLIDCQWLGAYPGAVDLDGFLRWAYCSWPANPNSDSTYDPWFGHWAAGGTYLAYPDGPSLRCLALFNGLNLSEKLKILRYEGRIDAELASVLHEFEYKGAKAYKTYPAQDVLRRTEALVHARSGGTVKRADFRIRDPFVLVENGTYYLYESKPWSGGQGVYVRTSTDLENWSEKLEVMKVPEEIACTAVWAPEVHKFNGRYYLFVTLTEEKGARPIVAMGQKVDAQYLKPRGTWGFVSDSPKGPFMALKKGPIPSAGLMTLDGTLCVEDGRPYMVYCHEWCQMGNGTMEYAPLTETLDGFAAAPTRLFDAKSAMPGAGNVTDGCFLYRSEKSKALYMIWSNVIKDHGYCVLVRRSDSGHLAGPWGKDEILYGENGGHGMIFRDLKGRLLLALHQPNVHERERMVLFELEDDGHGLRVKE